MFIRHKSFNKEKSVLEFYLHTLFKTPSTRIRIFLNPHFFFPDTASVHTHPVKSTANPDIFKSAVQSGEKINKSLTNLITRGRVNPEIFQSDDVANACPVSYRTINQYGSTTAITGHICHHYPALYGARYLSESGYHRMRVGQANSIQIRYV